MSARDERGQALPLVAVVVLVAGLFSVAVGHVGATVVGRAAAQTAADAAALAGAVHGRPGAERLAEANGARLISWEASGAEVEVVVSRRGEEARARARRGAG